MVMPNFLIIGAAKSGTTALYNYLKQHPEIYMSPAKEPRFFAFEGEKLNFQGVTSGMKNSITNLADYQALFKGVSREKAIGEASTIYLDIPKTVDRIKHYIPDAKLIAILRNPVDRAYSHFSMQIREAREPIMDFSKALACERKRIQDNWIPGFHYASKGLYYSKIKRYFDAFNREQIRVDLYEELKTDSLGLIQDIFSFLEVDKTFVPDTSIRFNVSGIPKNRMIHNFLGRPNPIKKALKPLLPKKLRNRLSASIKQRNLTKLPPMSPEVRQELIEVYREDILMLQDLLERDLYSWLE
ncbi:MAG: sulfotransferase [Hormoscilla sp. GM7CHS1pb]|nr:sulfotransferase [Hormoscilla sp. GM7CHS1pb]